MDMCPHCGSEEGFYQKERFKGSCETAYDIHGFIKEDGSNADMHDGIIYYFESVNVYCIECRKPIGKGKELIRGR